MRLWKWGLRLPSHMYQHPELPGMRVQWRLRRQRRRQRDRLLRCGRMPGQKRSLPRRGGVPKHSRVERVRVQARIRRRRSRSLWMRGSQWMQDRQRRLSSRWGFVWWTDPIVASLTEKLLLYKFKEWAEKIMFRPSSDFATRETKHGISETVFFSLFSFKSTTRFLDILIIPVSHVKS